MNQQHASSQPGIPSWLVALIAVASIVIAAVALTVTLVGRPSFPASFGGMMGGGGAYTPGGGMMGGYGAGGAGTLNGAQPGDPGFVAGTIATPRVLSIVAGPAYTFSPSSITVARGETITFQVTTVGPLVHEFMVGPADEVAADVEGTPEIADIGMMQTKTLTYTFDGPGPYAFACHADGHYEAGMRGEITIAE
jgi:uncharacterized cupredoxin-like copper-binding protein